MESCPGFGEGHKRFDFTVEKKNFIGNFQIKSTPVSYPASVYATSNQFKKCCIDCTPNSSVGYIF